MSVLQVIDSRKAFVRGNQKYHSSELQTILAIFRDAHVYKTNSILHICPLVDVPNKNSPSPSPARPSRGTGNQDTETRNLAHEIARHYERFIRVIRADAANYTCFTLAPSYRLQVCSADHPRPSSLLTTNLTIVEDAMWKRFHVEYSHATHHLDLAAHHMRLHKGGVKKGRAYLGLTEAVAKELVEIYDAPSEVIESLVRAGAMEIEEELQLVYSKLPRRCRCDKLFHFYVLAARWVQWARALDTSRPGVIKYSYVIKHRPGFVLTNDAPFSARSFGLRFLSCCAYIMILGRFASIVSSTALHFGRCMYTAMEQQPQCWEKSH